MKNDWLNEFRKDQIHSQFGEDGIVLKILSMLPEGEKNGWCDGPPDLEFVVAVGLLREVLGIEVLGLHTPRDAVQRIPSLRSRRPHTRIGAVASVITDGSGRVDFKRIGQPGVIHQLAEYAFGGR